MCEAHNIPEKNKSVRERFFLLLGWFLGSFWQFQFPRPVPLNLLFGLIGLGQPDLGTHPTPTLIINEDFEHIPHQKNHEINIFFSRTLFKKAFKV